MDLPNSFFNHDAQAGGFYPKSHAGIDISRLAQRQNYLIEGIRGTGKTHVLKMISRYYLDRFDELRVLPIYISLAQISEHARKDPDEFRLNLYAHIVQRCVETAEVNRSSLQPDANLFEKALQQIARLFRISNKPDLSELLGSIKQTAELLLFKLQFDLTGKSFKESTAKALPKPAGVASLPKADLAVLDASAGSTGVVEPIYAVSESEDALNYIGSRLVHHDAATFLLEFLKQLQVILNLEYSLILIDECSEASFRSQVEVFRLFKTIRGAGSSLPNKDTCAFFVGTVYPKGETYYPTRGQDGFTFEPGQDCTMEFLQWDETDLDSYVSFFETMTLNRAREVLGYAGDFGDLRRELFGDKNAFLLPALCAHGIPRRYWELVKRAYRPERGKDPVGSSRDSDSRNRQRPDPGT